jgi:hypothetical protein
MRPPGGIGFSGTEQIVDPVNGKMPEEYPLETPEGFILNNLNGYTFERKEFIETGFLEEAGFRRTGGVKYRKTKPSEKVLSVLQGLAHALSFERIPMAPFFGIEYDKLPEGEYYDFKQIILTSNYRDISPEVLIVLELEYKLQIEFCNGILYRNNVKYYDEDNIKYFEELIAKLPEAPDSIRKIKDRFLNIELPRIKSSVERYRNPTDDHLRIEENMGKLHMAP